MISNQFLRAPEWPDESAPPCRGHRAADRAGAVARLPVQPHHRGRPRRPEPRHAQPARAGKARRRMERQHPAFAHRPRRRLPGACGAAAAHPPIASWPERCAPHDARPGRAASVPAAQFRAAGKGAPGRAVQGGQRGAARSAGLPAARDHRPEDRTEWDRRRAGSGPHRAGAGQRAERSAGRYPALQPGAGSSRWRAASKPRWGPCWCKRPRSRRRWASGSICW